MDVDLRALISKLNEVCRRALESAAGLCLSRTNYNVEIEHWLLKICEVDRSDLNLIFREFEIDRQRVEAGLTRALDLLKTGNSRAPSLSPRIVDLIREAWVQATVEFGTWEIRSGHLLIVLLSHDELNRWITESCRELQKIPRDELKKKFISLTADSVEAVATAGAPGKSTDAGGGPAQKAATTFLDQYTVNLTERAQKGELDPVLGRDAEIRQMVDILIRRRQNNPILTGEAGVGKTAVVEGLALRIASGDVPEPLRPVILRTLDLGLLQAGASVKGEFENRLKGVIQEVKASPQPIILFIDEAHTIIGAGGQAGQSDAANLLKPALARGELRTIAATTWAEYKKYFEKDAALARRFQVVKVDEPSEELACRMLRGLSRTLEKHHKLRIMSEAVDAAVSLSHRYITGRQLPDKAVSLLDTASARVAVSRASIPAAVEDAQRDIASRTLQIEILEREIATGRDHSGEIARLSSERDGIQAKLQSLETRWKKENDLVVELNSVIAELEQLTAKPQDGAPPSLPVPPGKIEELQQRRSALSDELYELQGEEPLVHPHVNAQTIAEVVSGWTGIPVGKMMTDEIQLITSLAERMQARVIGQSHALQSVAQRIQTSRASLTDPRRPIGVFLLVGPSGVGKTETALTLSELLYGGERNLVSINMSEYQEAHTVSKLKGSPPGYVGYGEGGVLTEAVRRKPYCVVLLDEVEKADGDVLELFYQVFDKGVLEDGEGREIDFKNTIILLTSNVASDLIQSVCADPETRPEVAQLEATIRPELLKVFKPALLGRMTVVPYYPLADEVMRSIVHLQLSKVAQRLKDNHNAEFEYDPAVVDQVLARCKESETGARNVDHIITGTLLPELAREVLSRMIESAPFQRVKVSINDQSGFAYTFG